MVVRMLIIQILIPTITAGAPFWSVKRSRLDRLWSGVGQKLVNKLYRWGLGLPNSVSNAFIVLIGKIPPMICYCLRDTLKLYNRLVGGDIPLIHDALYNQQRLMQGGKDCWLLSLAVMVARISEEQGQHVLNLDMVDVEYLLGELWKINFSQLVATEYDCLAEECPNRSVVQYWRYSMTHVEQEEMRRGTFHEGGMAYSWEGVNVEMDNILLMRFRHQVTDARIHDFNMLFSHRMCRFCGECIETESHWILHCEMLQTVRDGFLGVDWSADYSVLLNDRNQNRWLSIIKQILVEIKLADEDMMSVEEDVENGSSGEIGGEEDQLIDVDDFAVMSDEEIDIEFHEVEVHEIPNQEGIDELMEALIDEGVVDGDALRMGLYGGDVVDDVG